MNAPLSTTETPVPASPPAHDGEPAHPVVPATPDPPLENQKSKTQSGNRRRNGKVARLPHRVRELLNLMLRDGAPYADIIQKVSEHGHTLNTDNLSRWHSGGYHDWLREQSLLDDQHARLDFAAEVVNKKNARLIQEASLRIPVLRMYNLLLEFDPTVLQEKISENPGAYARILNSLCKLTSGAVDLERHRLAQSDD